GTCARAWNVKFNDGAVLIAHKTMIHICLINIPSRNRSICIDSKRIGPLEGTWDVTGVRSIECREGASPLPQEPVAHIVRIKIVSHDGSIRSKAPTKSTLAGTRARARNIECGNHALLIPQKAVVPIGPVIVKSC